MTSILYTASLYSDEYTMTSCRNAARTSMSHLHISSSSLSTHLHRFIVRDFVYSEEDIGNQRQELQTTDTTEKELWVRRLSITILESKLTRNQTELLHLSRTNFSESFQLLVHLKVIRLFIESVLRYGLPANYTGLAIKVSRSTYHGGTYSPAISFFSRTPSQRRSYSAYCSHISHISARALVVRNRRRRLRKTSLENINH